MKPKIGVIQVVIDVPSEMKFVTWMDFMKVYKAAKPDRLSLSFLKNDSEVVAWEILKQLGCIWDWWICNCTNL